MSEVLAIFDFDGTLTKRDTLIPFLIFCEGSWKTVAKLSRAIPNFLGFFLGLQTRQQVKEAILTSFFKGKPIAEIQKLGQQYAETKLRKLVLPDRLERLKWHQSQGHRCILISANLDVYLEPWGKIERLNEVVSTRLETNNGYLTGKIAGLNCWGPEKKCRLEALIGSLDSYEIYMYGDSRGDKELLELAKHPFYRHIPKN